MKKEILTRLINLLLMALTVAKFSHHLYLLVKKRCLEFAANIKYCRRLKYSIVSESLYGFFLGCVFLQENTKV